jgi:hypothetical protein
VAAGDEATMSAAVAYVAVEEGADCGLYASGEHYQRKLTNFVARVAEERIESDVDDAGPPQKYFCGEILVAGRSCPFKMTPEAYSEKLRPSIFEAAGPAVEFLGPVDEVRTAISRISAEAGCQTRHVLTSPGWDDDGSRYLAQGVYVDRDGCHTTAKGDGVPEVDLSGNRHARRLGLLRLDAEELRRVKRHVLDDLMRLHDRNVASALMAAVPLAILIRRAGLDSWPALWLVGESGVGKSIAARLVYSFFADADPAGSDTVASWASTANILPAIGYGFRDALFLVDDYKREVVDAKVVTGVVQNYADRTSRARMKRDLSMAATMPIRGPMVSTGEDVPEAGASGLGRSVVIRVPTPERDPARLARCLETRPFYRGVTADLIAYVIREGVGPRFKADVDRWRQRYLALVSGHGNGARIAQNHACLAAAFEVFCDYMADVWGEAEATEAARAFAEDYLAGPVVEAAGGVADELPAAIFLRTLGELLAYGRVRLQGLGPAPGVSLDAHDRAPLVGRLQGKSAIGLAAGDVVMVPISLALAAVQGQLRDEGRPELRVSERALLDQLAGLGCLLDDDGRTITKDGDGEDGDGGKRTKPARIGGKSLRAARIPGRALLAAEADA